MRGKTGAGVVSAGLLSEVRAEKAGAAVLAWARDASLVVDAFEEERLLAMRLGKLAELTVPEGSDADLELTAQWAAFICLVDDRFDRSLVDIRPEAVTSLFTRLLNVITGRPAGFVSGLEQALDDLWRRTAPRMSTQWRERFVADYRDFALAMREEAAGRTDRVPMGLSDYVLRRRRTITALPLADILECTAGAPWPGPPICEDLMRDLRRAVADVAGWSNDLASAEDDLREDRDNLVTVLSRERGCSLSSAREQAAAMRDDRVRDFHTLAAALTAMPLPGTEREGVRRYVAALGSFVTATLHWLGVTHRFDARWATRPM
ncbi:terpene synthase family protein [Streptomyces sp. E5N91]|uniref:terpene synthase family protein n=1 Tax=Streptomyces sp. E5N91 TaxID=1851996 RepID=UPI000EF613AA|nr:terpene synthase family protein [Streptomyces sp. E5N91]